MQINTIKQLDYGYSINGGESFAPFNSSLELEIQEWIANGGIVAPEFTNAELLVNAKDKKKAEIKALRDSKFAEPLLAKSNPDVYLKPQPQTNIFLAAYAMADGSTKEWLPCDVHGVFANAEVSFTKLELTSVASHYEDRKTMEYNQCNKRCRAVDALTTIAAVEAYDINTVYE